MMTTYSDTPVSMTRTSLMTSHVVGVVAETYDDLMSVFQRSDNDTTSTTTNLIALKHVAIASSAAAGAAGAIRRLCVTCVPGYCMCVVCETLA